MWRSLCRQVPYRYRIYIYPHRYYPGERICHISSPRISSITKPKTRPVSHQSTQNTPRPSKTDLPWAIWINKNSFVVLLPQGTFMLICCDPAARVLVPTRQNVQYFVTRPGLFKRKNVLNTPRMWIYHYYYVSSAMHNTDIVISFDDAQKGFLWTDFRSISTRIYFCCGGEYLGGNVRQQAKCTQPERHWWFCHNLQSWTLRFNSE